MIVKNESSFFVNGLITIRAKHTESAYAAHFLILPCGRISSDKARNIHPTVTLIKYHLVTLIPYPTTL